MKPEEYIEMMISVFRDTGWHLWQVDSAIGVLFIEAQRLLELVEPHVVESSFHYYLVKQVSSFQIV